MKKFVLLHEGFVQPTDEIMAAWMQWFDDIAGMTVENVGLMPVKNLTPDGEEELPFDRTAFTGYTVLRAENQDQVLEAAKACPMITAIRIYEAREM